MNRLMFNPLKKMLLVLLFTGISQSVTAQTPADTTQTASQTASTVATNAATVTTVAATTDVEATMKAMALHYKKALGAADIEQMQKEINALQYEVATVQSYQFPPEKQQLFQKGLTEVQQQLLLVQQQLRDGKMAQAKEQLTQVDLLKKQYHKQRSPSFWQLLFGG
jgi:soluble cytochrome b562